MVKKIPKTQAFIKENDQLTSSKSSDKSIKDSNQDELKGVIDAFSAFDEDGDGHVSTREFINILIKFSDLLTPKDVHEIVRESNLDVKGKMNYRDFVEFWKDQ